jgi:hypothetical protein
MSDLADIITAGTGAAGLLGAGIAFLWRRVEKGFKEVKGELDKCRQREARSASASAKQLLVIELLWQIAPKTKAAADVLARCKKHLDDLNRLASKEDLDD